MRCAVRAPQGQGLHRRRAESRVRLPQHSRATRPAHLCPISLQNDLMTRGSVTAAFTVYSDFLTYKSGVYKHTTGAALGGHGA